MMNYNEYRLLTESIQGGMTLGLSRPSKVGGPVGSYFYEGEFGNHDHDEEDDDTDDDNDNEHEDDLDDDNNDVSGHSDDDFGDDGLDGDLSGTSSEDDGPHKGFPPDDSEEMDGLPTPDEEMLGDDDDDFLSSLGGDHGAHGGHPAAGGGDDMDFLNDIDPALMGGDDGLGGDDDSGLGAEEPCPDCNPDGSQEVGHPHCPSCDGMGFVGGEDGHASHPAHHGHSHKSHASHPAHQPPVDASLEDGDGDADAEHMTDFMNLMNAYMKKYMKKDGVVNYAPLSKHPKNSPELPHMKKFMKKDAKKCCNCEGTVNERDFLTSLTDQAKGTVHKKNSSGFHEDYLLQSIDPNYEPQPGSVGYAPQGRLNGVGGGYTKDDFKDIPVLGESYSFPTLAEYARMKAQIKAGKSRRRSGR